MKFEIDKSEVEDMMKKLEDKMKRCALRSRKDCKASIHFDKEHTLIGILKCGHRIIYINLDDDSITDEYIVDFI